LTTNTESASPFLRFTPIQSIEYEQNPDHLTLKHIFIVVEAVERESGQIG